MRYRDIIGEAETWEARFKNHQRQQQRRAKIKTKIATAQAAASDRARSAASAKARADDKLAGLQRDLAQPKL